MTKRKVLNLIKKADQRFAECELEIPQNKNFGHYSTNCALKLAKLEGKNSVELANELKNIILNQKEISDIFEKIEVVSPGFINFYLTPQSIQKEFTQIYKNKEKFFTKSFNNKGKVVVIDYSAPNIAKPMGIGHLRSTIIGQALYNIFKFTGYKVIGDNHLGDWGKQFGMLIAAYKNDGQPKRIDINYLMGLYVKFNAQMKENPELENIAREEVKKLQQGDKKNLAIWKKFYKVSISEFNQMYKLLNVKFDYFLGESFYNPMLNSLVKDALKNGVAQESQGAIVIEIGDNKTPMLIQKSDGAYLYATTDLATVKYRVNKFKPDLILYVIANEQSLHLEQLFIASKKLGLIKNEKLAHIKFGLILASDMKKFSTRAGKTIFLLDVINEAIERAKKTASDKKKDLTNKEKENIAKVVGIGAVKYNDLSQNRLSDIAFDWNRMLNLEGNSAPYLQYTYARLKSILRKAKQAKFDSKYLNDELEIDLMVKLSQFSDVLEKITQTYYPHYLTDYLYELAKQTNAYYQKVPVISADKNQKTARLALVYSISQTLKTGLNLLGIETLEKM